MSLALLALKGLLVSMHPTRTACSPRLVVLEAIRQCGKAKRSRQGWWNLVFVEVDSSKVSRACCQRTHDTLTFRRSFGSLVVVRLIERSRTLTLLSSHHSLKRLRQTFITRSTGILATFHSCFDKFGAQHRVRDSLQPRSSLDYRIACLSYRGAETSHF